MIRTSMIFAALAAFGTAARAEVKSSSGGGFEVEHRRVVNAAPATIFSALGQPSLWWNKAHTYSGDSANLTLGLKAGQCFCERLPDGGSVEHMRVVYARPGQTLRLQGGLGPLQMEAAIGTLTFALEPVAGGTQITQSYVIGGYVRGGADKFAQAVDRVLGEQLDGLVRRLSDKSGKTND